MEAGWLPAPGGGPAPLEEDGAGRRGVPTDMKNGEEGSVAVPWALGPGAGRGRGSGASEDLPGAAPRLGREVSSPERSSAAEG
ncbi:hypothetical protein Saso_65700 [Streptomyces asoensis]|uniref:Uncharacterized protein n=1 Tax=Streptomyces asoensis TaxID=249586 RepID=A0ABQ3SAC4_9ACTN|nr:hypothetical protein GCM10010496_70320 [Streptomyces asoensis]GHI64920.1 hypothetical protein Saso_65700 [Streptomyces asoensis]